MNRSLCLENFFIFDKLVVFLKNRMSLGLVLLEKLFMWTPMRTCSCTPQSDAIMITSQLTLKKLKVIVGSNYHTNYHTR